MSVYSVRTPATRLCQPHQGPHLHLDRAEHAGHRERAMALLGSKTSRSYAHDGRSGGDVYNLWLFLVGIEGFNSYWSMARPTP